MRDNWFTPQCELTATQKPLKQGKKTWTSEEAKQGRGGGGRFLLLQEPNSRLQGESCLETDWSRGNGHAVCGGIF